MRRYVSAENIDRMHKCVLAIEGEDNIQELSSTLRKEGVPHKLWIEQPENIPTCLAAAPRLKSQLSQFFRHLKLL